MIHMTYYVRYVVVDKNPISLSAITQLLQLSKDGYTINSDLLVFNDEEFGQITINEAGSNLFKDDLELMKRFAKKNENRGFLLSTLQNATSVVVVQAIWSLSQTETLNIIEGMFVCLMKKWSGLLMDEDGSFYYDLAAPDGNLSARE